MKNRGRNKKKLLDPLTLEQIITYATSDDHLAKSTWTRIAHTFALTPAIAGELRQAFSRVPPHPSNDPIISAIRRISHPTDRLPFRHRRAIAEAGTTKLSFLQLVLEEARTSSWRNLNMEPLCTVIEWLCQLPLRSFNRKASLEIAILACSYTTFFTLRFGVEIDFKESGVSIPTYEIHEIKDAWIVVEGKLSLGLLFAKQGDFTRSAECFHHAEQSFSRQAETDLVDLKPFISLCRGWAGSLAGGEAWKIECHFTDALASLDETADPWLLLYLHHEAAKASITHLVSQMLGAERLKKIYQELTHLAPEDQVNTLFFRLQEFYCEHSSAEADAIQRAHAHLEACDALYQEFKSEKLEAVQEWLWGHSLAHSNPIEGIDRMLRAIELGIKLNLESQIMTMIHDAFYLMAQLRRSPEPREKTRECTNRALDVMKIAFEYHKRCAAEQGGEALTQTFALQNSLDSPN